jgi:hypothetical protein
MQEYDVNLGIKELYTLKNFNFDIINQGSADLNVTDITTTSNIDINYISTPFTIVQDTSFNMIGYVKIVNVGDSYREDHIDFNVSYNDGEVIQTDVYRYYINYSSILYNTYTQVIELSNINYIKNMLILIIDSDNIAENFSSIILLSIDDISLYLFPIVYNLSDKKIAYIFKDNSIKNKVVDNNIKIFLSNDTKKLELSKIS